MSVVSKCGWLMGVSLLMPAVVSADKTTPFYNADADADFPGETMFFGNITSSSFYYAESSPQAVEEMPGGAPTNSASLDARLFSELRLQLQAEHIAGGRFDLKVDLRGRMTPEKCQPRLGRMDELVTACLKTQSGLNGGEERDVREVFVRFRAEKYHLKLGRQFMSEVAAVKFDGLSFVQKTDSALNYFGYAGAYPSRGSRDYRGDYPLVDNLEGTIRSRLVPIVGGAGITYKTESLYGSVAASALLPRGSLNATGLAERQRIFISSAGYWQQSPRTDFYHYLVVNAASETGAGLANFSLGANHRLGDTFRLFAQVNRVDTETLAVHAQLRLDPVSQDDAVAKELQNNWYISRVAQEAARLGASSSFRNNRFQFTLSGTLRRRPQIDLRTVDGEPLKLPAKGAQTADISVQIVDRESYEDLRISASATRSMGVGEENLDRATSTSVRVMASGRVGGKGEVELNVNYLKVDDQVIAEQNALGNFCADRSIDFLSCFGQAATSRFGAGALIFYRPRKNLLVMAMANISSQAITSSNVPITMETPSTKQPAITSLTGFLRVAYRF